MNAEEYLQDQLKNASKYELTPEDKKIIDTQGIKEYIYKKLTSKKFRKFKMTPESEAQTKIAIDIAVDNDKPLEVVYFIGGYKLWRLDTTPYPDWAEFFNISYILAYIAPIAAAFDLGVNLTYYMHTLLMEVHDNLTTEEISKYVISFDKLLSKFKEYLPDNIDIKSLKDADLYARDEYFKVLEDNYKEGEKLFYSLPLERQEQLKSHGYLNIKWNGKENWTNLTSEEKEQKTIKGGIYELTATTYLKRPQETAKGKDKVILFVKSGGGFIGVGSCKTSVAKFWVGVGILENRDGKYYPRILSPSQYEDVKEKLSTEKIDLIDQYNFKQILILDGKLDYSK